MRRKIPLVSIIIVNWNGGEVLRQCLESLAKINYPNWELVIVDNGSTDESITGVMSTTGITRTKIIKNRENLGFAKANNQGYKKARGKYILLLNNDTRVTSDFLSKLVARAEEDSSIGVIQPKIFLMDRPGYLDNAGSFLTRIGFFYHWGFLEKDGPEFEQERDIFSAKGACMLIKHSVIEEVGLLQGNKLCLFDEDFISYFEETDFCWRVWLAGYRVVYYPRAKIYHKVGFTIRRLDTSNINYHYYKNRITALLKNLETRNLPIFLIPHLIVSTGVAAAFLLLRPKNSLVILGAILWNFINIGRISKKRKEVQELRKVKDKKLFDKLLVPVDWRRFFADFKRVKEDLERPRQN